jgi:protein BCP1
MYPKGAILQIGCLVPLGLNFWQFATHTLDFDYSHQEPRDRDSFGTDVAGRMMLIPSAKLDQMVQAMTAKFPVPV